jgi:hypothetical protein
MADPIRPEEWLRALIEQGEALRNVGVTRVEIAGCVADLAPRQERINEELLERIAELEAATERGGDDPLDRPGTFGGHVPRMGGGRGGRVLMGDD